MSFEGSADAKEQVKRAIDIVDLVGGYIQLRREGRGYKGLCPWHDDSRPSLQVNPERQSFKCWVCDIGGDIFSFTMKMEGVAFGEALAMLADRAGVTLTTRSGGAANQDEKRALYQAMAWAENEFHQCLLNSAEAEAARRYLRERGVTDESVRAFHLGYAPDRWDWLPGRAREARIAPAVLEKVGLIGVRRSGQGYYDRFKGRVLFSIRDPLGRCVAMGGRLLPGASDEKAAKYINSPETPLFSKNKTLYALDVARDAIAKKRSALVMEGYTDCIVAHQCGFTNTVAVLGTALGERHIRELRLADCVYMVLDGDEAGRRRADQILDLFVAAQVDVRILTLPDDLDPCDFLLTRGTAAFESLLFKAVDALEHRFQLATEHVDMASGTHAAHRALEAVLATLSKAARNSISADSALQLREDQILSRLSQRFAIPEERVRTRLAALRRQARGWRGANAAPTTTTPVTGRTSQSVSAASEARETLPSGILDSTAERAPKRIHLAERWLLEMVISQPHYLASMRSSVDAEHFQHALHRSIFARCLEQSDAGVAISFDQLLVDFEDLEVKSLLVDLEDEQRGLKVDEPERELRKLVEILLEFREQRAAPVRSMARGDGRAGTSPASKDDEELAALEQFIKRERNRQGISVPMDG